jgi:hypothetical protein
MVSTGPNLIIPKFRPKEDKAWWDGVMRGIHLGIGKEKVLQENRMKDNARMEAMTPRKTVEGLGQLTAVFDLQNYLRWDQAERGCWGNKQFVREYLRDNPEARAARPERKYI